MIIDKLYKTLEERQSLKRSLSTHVTTRWYRAPEVCLVARQYDQAADMWGFGCTLYEILTFSIRDQVNLSL